MSAPAGNVFRVHLADPGGRTDVIDVPTEDFEVSERGIMLGGNKVVPWHRVIRYTRETTQEVDEAFPHARRDADLAGRRHRRG